MRDRLKTVFQNFAETTTAHAPPKIITHTHILSKLFWALLFLTGIVVFVYFCQELVSSFLKYERTTDIELKFRVLEFPAVTICNQNQFRADRVPPELKDLVVEFLNAKRAEMFGGQDKFDEYQSVLAGRDVDADNNEGHSPASEAAMTMLSGLAGSASSYVVNLTTQASSASPPARTRRKRAMETLSDEESLIIDDLEGFYSKPDLQDFANMTWFDNVGESSAEKDMILNLTQYITTHYDQAALASAGHDIEEMLQECTFLGKTCGPEHFYHFYDMKYGNCYTFNSGMDKTVAKISNPGASLGLSMTFFINQGQYIPVLTQEAGLRVMLHRQGQVPIIEEDGFDVAPGTKSGIAVKYVEISRLAGYKGDCINGINRTNTHSYYPGNYTQKACIKTCLQKGIIKDCGCATPLYRYPADVSMCGLAENECVENVELNLLDNGTCSDGCPTPCWESQYQYSISSSQWPSKQYMPYLKESLDERGDTMKGVMEADTQKGLSEEFLKVVVYYDNLNYNRYTERLAITEKDLIGAVGGHLGLWIGMSIISFIEFFELILLLIKWFVHKVKSNKTSSLTDLKKEKVETPVHTFHKDSWVKDN